MIYILFILSGIIHILIGILGYIVYEEFYNTKTRYTLRQRNNCIYLIKETYRSNEILKREIILKMHENQIEVL